MGWKVFGLVTSILFLVIALSITAITLSGLSGKSDAAPTPPTVDTPYGRYVGVPDISNFTGQNFVTYRSIPFAKPPVGTLRFQRPQPLERHESTQILNSITFKVSCLTETKLNFAPSAYGEDCLYLNIYAPEVKDPALKYPVMVWLHGGGFVAGSTFPDPIKLMSRGNVIVVTVNYRLSVFGFLTTMDNSLPSNNGIWDQYMALSWVKENIQYFNGDNGSITLFGQSAGAISTGLHCFSPISSKLFHKAILQSGSVTSIITRNAKQRALELGAKVGCSQAQGQAFADCLRQVSASTLLNNSIPSVYNISLAQRQSDFLWQPVVDGQIIPYEPLTMLKNLTYLREINFTGKDYLLGTQYNEGGLIPENFLNPVKLVELSKVEFFKDLVTYLLYARYGIKDSDYPRLRDAVYTFYTGSSSPATPLNSQFVQDLAGDVMFVVPAIETALALTRSLNQTSVTSPDSAQPKVYMYKFDYCPNPQEATRFPCMTHGSEFSFQFPKAPFSDVTQEKLSNTFIDLLTTFARSSNPETVVPSGWPLFEPGDQLYLSLDENPARRRYPYDYRLKFWLDTVPSLLN
ncbi:fatty acyl-CoA hydrolase precursor, medium chain-like isoform X1 [Physella acuta]|nr:fatty acyl-CoA hydrolase precursor, medium chain-like isoform X1 [Physella acuta]XP_059143130.1 fatty acyl-CoA hydrolase precursor, medium chain-like isoform X1 [Physella acuta]XP_059143131.1 fatty acyl-CoA hydrolase precursor, medium chain-like isoform X1 [Physella acuta]XP_059143132.1 fatty acyl-CoA hydrolase precursor, medium chain-like isoform X1 [Physella acuta]XP_059143133.1 fatty acyl-CoA hydrolase precursor, medium chain-like isoform X1 [Physella acuta]XP_059143134.1 fatty acyl-CoA 